VLCSKHIERLGTPECVVPNISSALELQNGLFQAYFKPQSCRKLRSQTYSTPHSSRMLRSKHIERLVTPECFVPKLQNASLQTSSTPDSSRMLRSNHIERLGIPECFVPIIFSAMDLQRLVTPECFVPNILFSALELQNALFQTYLEPWSCRIRCSNHITPDSSRMLRSNHLERFGTPE
jgi:hypothetical protein